MYDDLKFWGSATVGSKGQVVIPAEGRTELDISEGDKLIVIGSAKSGTVSFVKANSLEQMMQAMQKHLETMQQTLDKKGEDNE